MRVREDQKANIGVRRWRRRGVRGGARVAGASPPLARVQEVKSFSSKGKASVRDLRIREDTAKYLLNLDVESAFYDPKSRCV